MDDYDELNENTNIFNLKNLSDIAIDLEKKFNKINVHNFNFSEEDFNDINNNIKLKNKIRKQIDIRYQIYRFYNYEKIKDDPDFIEEYKLNEVKLLNLLESAVNILQSLLNFVNTDKYKINTSEEQTQKKLDLEINLNLDKEIIKLFSKDKDAILDTDVITKVFNNNVNNVKLI